MISVIILGVLGFMFAGPLGALTGVVIGCILASN